MVHIGDHLRLGIICGPVLGSFPVWGSFAVGDHLRRCTEPCLIDLGRNRNLSFTWMGRLLGTWVAWHRLDDLNCRRLILKANQCGYTGLL